MGFCTPYSSDSQSKPGDLHHLLFRRGEVLHVRVLRIEPSEPHAGKLSCAFFAMARRRQSPKLPKPFLVAEEQFSITERLGIRLPSWKTMPIPSLMALSGPSSRVVSPLRTISPSSGLLQPDHDFHQGGFAGAVLPDEAEDLVGTQGHIHALEGDHPGKQFRDAFHLEHWRIHGPDRLPSYLMIPIFLRSIVRVTAPMRTMPFTALWM